MEEQMGKKERCEGNGVKTLEQNSEGQRKETWRKGRSKNKEAEVELFPSMKLGGHGGKN